MIEITDKSLCCGCNACVQRCPKHCITMNEDEEGFFYPSVDPSTCIDCGLCEKVCPIQNAGTGIMPVQVLAAKNRDENIRMHSSSGGVFHALACTVIQHGGIVFGAVYSNAWEVEITYTDNLEGIKLMMGSKYVQAKVGDAYQKAEQFLKQGREVLFTGTPCQIAGLRHFLHNKEYENLLAVDFLCHGVPSPGVWRRYLSDTFGDHSARRAAVGKNTVLNSSLNAIPAITGIAFRDKSLYGWKKFSFVVRGKSAFKADSNSVLLSDMHQNNPYMKGFLSNLYLRPSCYNCHCKEGVNHSDLTIADFWGVDKLMPDFDDDKGVGLVLVYTGKGRNTFDSLDMDIREANFEEAVSRNGGYYPHARPNPKRADFFTAFYEKKETVAFIVHSLTHIALWRRIAGKIKRTIIRKPK